MSALANSEDPHEMPHNTAFHYIESSLFDNLRQKGSSENEIQLYLENYNLWPKLTILYLVSKKLHISKG